MESSENGSEQSCIADWSGMGWDENGRGHIFKGAHVQFCLGVSAVRREKDDQVEWQQKWDPGCSPRASSKCLILSITLVLYELYIVISDAWCVQLGVVK